MTQHVNTYKLILKLPDDVTEPDDYQLLGIKRFESDAKIIKNAALDRNGLLLGWQNSEHHKDVTRILKEITTAHQRLSDPKKKADYDRQLKQRLGLADPPVVASTPERPTVSVSAPGSETSEIPLQPNVPPPKNPERKPSVVQLTPVPGERQRRKSPPPPPPKAKRPDSNELKAKKAAVLVSPGESPWSDPAEWWRGGSPLRKGLTIAIAGILALGLLILIWPGGEPDSDPENLSANDQTESAPDGNVIGPATADKLSSQVLFQAPSRSLEAMAMASDGSWVATLEADGLVRFWDQHSKAVSVLNQTPGQDASGPCTCLTATPDGMHLLAGTPQGAIAHWQIDSSQTPVNVTTKLHRPALFSRGIRQLVATGNGSQVCCLDTASQLSTFDWATGQSDLSRSFSSTVYSLNVFASRPDASGVALCWPDQSIRLWNPEAAAQEPSLLVQHARPDLALAYSPDGSTLASAGADQVIRLTDVNNSGSERLLSGHIDRIYALDFSPDGKTLASAGAKGAVNLWNVADGKLLASLPGHAEAVLALRFSHDGGTLTTASQDGEVRRYHVSGSAAAATENHPVAKADNPPPTEAREAITNATAARLAVAQRLAVGDGQGISEFPPAITQDGTLIVASNPQGPLLLWDAKTGERRREIPLPPAGTPAHSQFVPDGNTLLTAGPDGKFRAWDVLTRRLVHELFFEAAGRHPMLVSQDGKRLVLAGASGQVQIYAGFETLSTPATTFSASGEILDAALTPDGTRLVCQLQTAVEVWSLGPSDLAPVPQRETSINVPDTSISQFAFGRFRRGNYGFALAADGQRFALGSADGKLHVYQVSGQESRSFSAHTGPVQSVAFSPDGSLLMSGGGDGLLRIWDLTTYRPLADLSVSAPANTPGRSAFGERFSRSSQQITQIELTPDGTRLMTAHDNGQVQFWQVGPARPPAAAIATNTPTRPDPSPSPLPASASPSTPVLDLRIAGPAQSLSLENVNALGKWIEMPAHSQAVTALEYSPDGQYLATLGADRIVRFWDTSTGSLHHYVPLAGTPGPPQGGAPRGGPGMMDPYGRPGSLYDYNSLDESLGPGRSAPAGGIEGMMEQPGNAPLPPQNALGRLAFSPDSRWLVTTEDQRTLKLWDAASGANYGFIGDAKLQNSWFGYSAEGKTLVILANRQTLGFWDTTNRHRQGVVVVSAPIESIAPAPPNSAYVLATGNSQGEILLWETLDKTPDTTLAGHKAKIHHLLFSPDGKRLASCDQQGELKIWDVAAKTAIAQRSLSNGRLGDWVFTPDSLALITLHSDGTLRFLAVGEPDASQDRFANLTKPTAGHQLALSPDGKLLATANSSGHVEFWGVGDQSAAFQPVGYYQTPAVSPSSTPFKNPLAMTSDRAKDVTELAAFPAHANAIWSVEFTPDSTAFLTGSSDKTACLWDVFSHQPRFTMAGHTGRIIAVAASSDGQHFATASADGKIKTWNPTTGAELRSFAGHPKGITHLEFSPSGHLLASAGQDTLIKIWNASSGTETQKLSGHKATTLAWISDSSLISGGKDNRIHSWATLSGKPNTTPGHGGAVLCVAALSGGRLAFGTDRGSIGLWDGDGDQPEDWIRLRGHTNDVTGVAFSPDGSLLASASWDLTIKLWDAATGEELRTLTPNAQAVPGEKQPAQTAHAKQIHCLCFSPDGRWLVTGDAGGTIKLWGLPAE